ncbi:Uncharacterised protein [Mycobacteroides abscessus subsp. abscessus]|nr:Uncharacterised protein [Mycobacteroides abscessus subsp. abscessus]
MIGDHLTDHRAHRLDLGQRCHIGPIDHMDEKIRVGNLFQRGPECLDQLGRQVPHETNGVRDDEFAAVIECSAARRGFERGEQRVLNEHPCPGDRVQQTGFTGVRVADDGNRRDIAFQAAAALGVTNLLHIADLAAQLGHALADPAPIGLDLRFTGATGAHPATGAAGTTTGLPGHRFTPATQSRQHVLHLRQRDLRLTLAAGRVLGEDVQDQGGAIDDLDLDRLFQGHQLCRA